MDIAEAMEILEIQSLKDISEEKIKSNYRKLAREHHPDVGGDHLMAVKINSAHDIIKQVIKEIELMNKINSLSNKQNIFGIIPFDKFIGVYKNEEIQLKSGEDIYTITRRNIRANNIILDIGCKIMVDGTIYDFRSLSKINTSDNYSIRCVISDESITKERDIKIEAHGKNINLKLKGQITSIVLNYDNIARVTITVERRIPKDG